MKKVKKAVIPAAGFGTRVLPATKAMPKEMINIVDKPSIQYIVEEASAAGIEDILIITSRGKTVIEDHFDRVPELEANLDAKNSPYLASVQKSTNLANIYFVRQKEMRGLGHAISCARSFVADEPFAVLYGDDVILGDDPVCSQLIRAYEKYGKAAVGVKEVSREAIAKYSSLKVENIQDNCYNCTDMIEKPLPGQEFSLFSILGRCILTPDIFEILDNTEPGAGGEIQLTDAMAVLARTEGVTAVDFVGRRYDMGNKLGIMQACVEVAIKHPEIGEDFLNYIKNLVTSL